MSAAPQLPERVLHTNLSNGVKHDYHNKEASVIHIENAYPNGIEHKTNGIKKENSVKTSQHATNDFQMHDAVVENFRPIKVIVIGAGYSGIYHGIRIPERIKNCELVIYDKNAGVGGTW